MLKSECMKTTCNGTRNNLAFVELKNYNLNKENDRLRSFLENGSKIQNINELALLGYYFVQHPDVVKCQFCHVVQIGSEIIDNVISNHLRVSPNCPLLIRRTTLNQAVSESKLERILPPVSYDVCGFGNEEMTTQSYENPASSRRVSRRLSTIESYIKYPEFKLLCNRITSFASWPRGIKQRPQELAEAGFFYSGKGDEVVCFSCGLGICQLEPDDNLWVEHAKLLIGECSYLNLNREILKTNQIKYQEHLNSKESKKVELEQCNHSENEGTESSIETKCKVCLDRKANIVFLPCKHVAVCSQCVFGINEKCIICRGIIKDKISLYFS